LHLQFITSSKGYVPLIKPMSKRQAFKHSQLFLVILQYTNTDED